MAEMFRIFSVLLVTSIFSPIRTDNIRLVNGPDQQSGTVEVFYGGEWGTICDDSFDILDAIVICKMLNMYSGSNVPIAYANAHFGQGHGNIIIDELSCTGNESEITACGSNPWLTHDCIHNEDAGVDCKGSNIHLSILPDTTVMVTLNGIRSSICDDSFSQNDADVICKSRGFPGVKTYFTREGSGQVFFTSLGCSGREDNFTQCSYSLNPGNRTCQQIHVQCENKVRLVNGPDQHSGRVEVYYRGNWGTICDDGFDREDASVICKMLNMYDGYSSHAKAYSGAPFGQGSGNITIDDLDCIGSEKDIADCQSRPWLTHNCGHGEDAGVECRATNVQLSSYRNGSVEVLINDSRGSICDDSFTNEDSEVICRTAGFPGISEAHYTVNGNGPVVITNLSCSGGEHDIIHCLHTPYHGYKVCPRIHVQCANKIRLVNSPSQYSGTVEVYYNGEWGTICDDNFDHKDAIVICRMMGINQKLQYVKAYKGAHFGPGSGNTMISNLSCAGNEEELSKCSSMPWLSYSCSHSSDAGVDCDVFNVPISSGPDGLIEVFVNGSRGSICDDSFVFGDAAVICRSLGSPGVKTYYTVQGSGPVALTNLRCSGGERDISHCTFILYHGSMICQRAHVQCENKVRLVNGSNQHSGRVEVYHRGKWGTICDDSFDINDAIVICRMLHMFNGNSATRAYTVAHFGQGSGNITIDDLACRGDETELLDCASRVWLTSDCSHAEDAGVDCGVPLSSTSTVNPMHVTNYGQATTQSVTDIIYVSCNENGWQIDLDFYKLRQMYPSAVASDIYLGENSCTGMEYYGTLRFRQGLSECLTNEIMRNNVLVYTNEMIYAQHDRHNPFIIKSINWTVPIECDVDKNGSSDGLFHHTGNSVTAKPAVVGHSKYSIKIAFYDDPNFAHEIEGNPLQIQLGSKVYVKVFTPVADWNVKMRVHTCFAKPTADAPNQLRYDIIKNGCEVDANTHLLLQYAHETRLVFQDFQYTNNHDTIYLHCDANFCDTNDFSPACSQTCQTS